MGRTTGPDTAPPRRGRGRDDAPRSSQSRTVVISKACSKLLRHQAVNEGIPITSDGWVRLDHLLSWKGLSGRNGPNPPPTIEDIFDAVEDNDKKRFAVRWIRTRAKDMTESVAQGHEQTVKEVQIQPSTTIKDLVSTGQAQSTTSEASTSRAQTNEANGNVNDSHDDLETDAEAQRAESETAQAISHYRNAKPTPPAFEFLIRAVQGHSIQTVASDTSLLKPITLDDPSSIPDTCVHGTFYGAWNDILRSGGLKPMGRNHVHFAAGPSLNEIGVTEDASATQEASDKVISGMRRDAQLLIYIDLKRCLQDVKEKGIEMLWWRSENEVILTEGVEASLVTDVSESTAPGVEGGSIPTTEVLGSTQEGTTDEELQARARGTVKTLDLVLEPGQIPQIARHEPCEHTADPGGDPTDSRSKGKKQHHGGKGKHAQAASQSKLVPLRYWKVVVDVKGEHGVIWRQGEGVVKQLPDELLRKGTPKSFRGRGGRGRGRGR
ncbi:tRNA 2'-phosphotransferase [Lithohypha guttulata]|nr:tRNA 2'-phosphotransferase [Lithohypha guttulata]